MKRFFAISENVEEKTKDVWRDVVSKPTISVWHLFSLTVRQYQTHNIQYFTVCDSFSLSHITDLFRANKQWRVLWKLSIYSFPVMTSHLQLMRIVIFFSSVASVLLHPCQVKVPLTASPSWISFLSARDGERVWEKHFPIGSGINWTFSWTANTD